MRLIDVRVENFKSINDSTVFSIDSVTCLVGKNESGKTALLQALAKLNPIVKSTGQFQDLEFPRMTHADYTDEDRPKDVLTTNWELDDEDIEVVEDTLGEGTITSRTITIKKGYKNKLEWSIDIDYQSIVSNFLEAASLHAEERNNLDGIKNTSDLFKALRGISEPSPRESKLLSSLEASFPEGSSFATATKILGERLPQFLYFGQYETMHGEVALQQIANAKANSTLTTSDRIFIALLEMAGTKVEEIQSIGRFESLIAKLEAVSNRLSREIFRYWSQNKHLAIDFRFDAARPQDPPPFNEGYIFRTRIKNTRHGVTVSFDERSTGFVWFFSFLVWFSQVKEAYGDNVIILLDEPGLNLHAKAQADLLRYIKEKLEPRYQVIYTTHSPFMIDPAHLLSVRTVEDVIRDEEILGTKVSSEVLSTDRDTLFPLQAALGYDIAQTLFVGEHVLLVEGPSDLLYLQWASDQLRRRKRTHLDTRWVITPAGSIDKIASFVTLFGGNRIHVATLTDMGQGDKSKVQRLRDHQLLKAGHVLTVDAYANQPEADIEDIFGRAAYVTLINNCYRLPKTHAMPIKPTSDSLTRIVKDAERHFAPLPSSVPEFDHYTPAVYLVEHSTELLPKLPDIEEVLDRFETLFTDINSLLS
jgi:predicted ATP-dependent endonuclease of OLD family